MKRDLYTFSVLLLVLALAYTGLTIISCDDDDDDDNDDDDDDDNDDNDDNDTDDDDDDDDNWFPPDPGMTFLYEVVEWTFLEFEFEATVIGDDTFDDGTYTKFEFGDLDATDAIGAELWFDLTTVNEVGFKGANMYWSDADKISNKAAVPDGSFTLDDPVILYVSQTGGVPQTSSADGEWNDPTYGVVPVSMEFTSTTTSVNATVTVPYGTVDNCTVVALEVYEEFAHTYQNRTVNVNLTFHEDLGLVKVDGDFVFGFTLALKDVL